MMIYLLEKKAMRGKRRAHSPESEDASIKLLIRGTNASCGSRPERVKQPGFVDQENRLFELETSGDPLVRLDQIVGWDAFKALLKKIDNKTRKSEVGRKSWSSVRMFEIRALQTLYNLLNDQTRFPMRDGLSLQWFLGLAPEDRVPDAKTFWLFR